MNLLQILQLLLILSMYICIEVTFRRAYSSANDLGGKQRPLASPPSMRWPAVVLKTPTTWLFVALAVFAHLFLARLQAERYSPVYSLPKAPLSNIIEDAAEGRICALDGYHYLGDALVSNPLDGYSYLEHALVATPCDGSGQVRTGILVKQTRPKPTIAQVEELMRKAVEQRFEEQLVLAGLEPGSATPPPITMHRERYLDSLLDLLLPFIQVVGMILAFVALIIAGLEHLRKAAPAGIQGDWQDRLPVQPVVQQDLPAPLRNEQLDLLLKVATSPPLLAGTALALAAVLTPGEPIILLVFLVVFRLSLGFAKPS